MKLVEDVRRWWRQQTDPVERRNRIERKKAEQMARFLDRNQEYEEGAEE